MGQDVVVQRTFLQSPCGQQISVSSGLIFSWTSQSRGDAETGLLYNLHHAIVTGKGTERVDDLLWGLAPVQMRAISSIRSSINVALELCWTGREARPLDCIEKDSTADQTHRCYTQCMSAQLCTCVPHSSFLPPQRKAMCADHCS